MRVFNLMIVKQEHIFTTSMEDHPPAILKPVNMFGLLSFRISSRTTFHLQYNATPLFLVTREISQGGSLVIFKNCKVFGWDSIQ